MPESPRKRAVKILMNIDKNAAYINIEMNKLRSENDYSPVDLRFVGQLVNGVVKYRIAIDYLISKYSKVKINKIAPFVLAVLRSGIYQIIYLDKVPDSAAVNESVKLIKKSSVSRLSGYVNAILRAVKREDLEELDLSDVSGLSTYYSFPMWLVKRWIGQFGIEFTKELLDSFNRTPDFCIRRKCGISAENILSELSDNNIDAKPVTFDFVPEFDYCFNLGNVGQLSSLNAFRNNFFYIQDPAAALAAYLLEPLPGETVIDMCAAPGGKSLFIAELMNDKGRVVSCDIYDHKLKLIKDNCDKFGISIVEPVISDATVQKSEYVGKADRVLCDVPCSGLGIIRKKPDIKYARSEDDIKSLSALDRTIVENARAYLKPGGVLVYSTCTIEPEENEKLIEEFLSQHSDFKPYPFDGEDFYKTFYPNVHGTDGFFVCRIKKDSEN